MRALTCFLFLLSVLALRAQDPECGTVTPPGYEQQLMQRLAALPPSGQRISTLQRVPVRIHLFRRTNGFSTITIEDIRAELDSANFFYASAGIRFFECDTPNVVNDDAFYNYSSSMQSTVVSMYASPNMLNLYFANTVSVGTGSVCGYSFFPGSGPDACFIAAGCATNGSSLAHEMGHYFGLMHTHGGSPGELVDGSNCATEGDLICDTPADPNLNGLVNSACAYFGTDTDATGAFYQPDVHNIMSYSRKSCRNHFTALQYQVIHDTWLNERNYLHCPLPLIAGVAVPVVQMFPNPAGQQVVLSNLPADSVARTVSLYDMTGRLIAKQEVLFASTVTLQLGLPAEGTYVLRLTGPEGVLFTERLVIKR